ncbi:MAG: hypothetical protein M3Y70_02075 [Pseudomonadota bacterium]|nr:hypothetical protein [Pseudomonadota bacterium]
MKYLLSLGYSILGLLEERLFDRWVDARTHYRRAHALAGGRPPLLILKRLAAVSAIVEQYALPGAEGTGGWKAIADRCNDVLSAGKASTAWYIRLGDAHVACNDWSAAADAYRDALAKDACCSVAQYKLGSALSRLGKRGAAIRAYSSAFVGDRLGEKIDWYADLARCLQAPVPSSSAAGVPDLVETGGVGREVAWRLDFCRLMRAGSVREAYSMKRQAAEGALRSLDWISPPRFNVVVEAAQAAAWLRQVDRAIEILHRLEGMARTDRQRRIVGCLGLSINLQAGELGGIARFRPLAAAGLRQDGVDRAYRNLVKGKRIAVVCPGRSEAGQGQEIDSFELVVRTNFHGPEAIDGNAAHGGSRCDISYYNRQHFRSKAGQVREGLSGSRLRFLVARDHYFNRMSTYMSGIPARKRWSCGLIFGGRGFALAHIANDLLAFEPSETKIFCADFFLGSDPHYRGYFDDAIDVREAYLLHDPVATLGFLEGLWRNGYIAADPTLERILRLDGDAFVDELERRCLDQESRSS